MFAKVAAVGAVPFVVLLDQDVPREAEEAARARSEARLRAESEQIRREAQERADRARKAAEQQVQMAADRARRDAVATAAEQAATRGYRTF